MALERQRSAFFSMMPPPLLLLLMLSFSCWCGVVVSARPSPSSPSSSSSSASVVSFIKSWCAGTEYPSLCDATLAPYAAAVGSSPARLSWAALKVTLGGARAATAAMEGMAAAASHLTPVGAEAARDCVSMLGDAEDLLEQAVDAMASLAEQKGKAVGSSRDVRFQVDSVQTWASAALTNDDMCVEGFKGEAAGGGAVLEAVRGHVAGVSHLTANALGIVNAMAKQIP